MYLIKELYENDVISKKTQKKNVRYKLRRAARALVFYRDKIAILNASKLYLHKLPGGGIEDNESRVTGLVREVMEETGCRIVNPHELGATIEYRDEIGMLQISYAFVCNAQDASGPPNFTKKEMDEGFQLVWLTIKEAIKVMKNKDKPVTYAGKFIQKRDLAILEYFLRRA